MKIVCLQENFKNALSIIERSTGQNSTLPILSTILLETENGLLKISATNLELGVITWIPAKIDKKGEICVQSKILNGFINNLTNGKIDILLNENILNIKKDEFEANLLISDPKSFPIIPKIKSDKKIKIKQKDLKESILKVLNSASILDLRPEITGIYFNFKKDGLKLVSTDSFRLSEKQIITDSNINNENNFILPIKTAQELNRLLKETEDDLNIFIDKNQIMFEFDNIQIYSKLIDGQYPPYEQIIPKNFKTKTIFKKQDFLNSLKIASVFCGKTNDVKIKILNNNIEISAQDSEKGENKNKVNTQTTGPEIETVFNYKYLIDGLNNINDSDIAFSFNEKNTPTLMSGLKEKGYIYIVMPIRSN